MLKEGYHLNNRTRAEQAAKPFAWKRQIKRNMKKQRSVKIKVPSVLKAWAHADIFGNITYVDVDATREQMEAMKAEYRSEKVIRVEIRLATLTRSRRGKVK